MRQSTFPFSSSRSVSALTPRFNSILLNIFTLTSMFFVEICLLMLLLWS